MSHKNRMSLKLDNLAQGAGFSGGAEMAVIRQVRHFMLFINSILELL